MNTIQTSSRFDVALQISQQQQSNETTQSFATLLQKSQPAKEVDEADLAIQEKIDKEIESFKYLMSPLKPIEANEATAENLSFDDWYDFSATKKSSVTTLEYEGQIENLKKLRNGSAENRATWDRIDKLLSTGEDQWFPQVLGLRQAALEMILAGAGDVAEEMVRDAVANNNVETLDKLFQSSFAEKTYQQHLKNGLALVQFGANPDDPEYQRLLSDYSKDIFTSTTREGILEELSGIFTDDVKQRAHGWFESDRRWLGIDNKTAQQNIEPSIQNLLAIIQNAHNSFAERNLAFVENETQEFLARFGAK